MCSSHFEQNSQGTLFNPSFIKKAYDTEKNTIIRKRLDNDIYLGPTSRIKKSTSTSDQYSDMGASGVSGNSSGKPKYPILLAFIAIGLMFLAYDPFRNLPFKPENPLAHFRTSLNNFLQQHPTAHDPDDADMIKIIALKYLNSTVAGNLDKVPLVLTLAQKPSHNATDSDEPDQRFYTFAMELGSLIARAANASRPKLAPIIHGPRVINVSEFTGAEHEQKQLIDTELEMAYATGHRIFIMRDIEKLAPKTALIFHTLCDDANAPYPGSLYILLINPTTCPGYVCPEPPILPDHEPQLSRDSLLSRHHQDEPYSTSSLESYLAHKWSQGVGDDKVAALLSRMAAHIAFIEV